MPAENLSKDEELRLGTLIQAKLSSEAAEIIEPLEPREAICLQEEFNRALQAMCPEDRAPLTATLAAELNGVKETKKLMDWAPSFEFFSPEDMSTLQCGWEEKKTKSLARSLKSAEYLPSSRISEPGFDDSMRAKVIRQGDRAAKQLVESHVLLVRKMAHDFKRKMPASPDHEDIFAQGMIGLWKAVLKYDPRRGNKFSTVAFSWIRQSITREINNTHRLVRLPENRVGDYIAISRIRRSVSEQNLSENEIEDLVMEELGLSRAKIREITNAASNHASLNKTVGEDDGEKELIHYVAKSHPAAEEQAVEGEMQTILNMALSDLEGLELEIVVSAFKLDYSSMEHRTVKSICAEHDITPSQYRRISTGAIKKIRSHMEKYGVTFSDFFG